MPPSFEAIVVGLGATGGAALYHLARRNVRVLGLDRFAPPHDRGSSHGHTRIYRQAYYEAPEYVPLAVRALELWRELEHDAAQTLFANTGALTIGAEQGPLYSGALRSARHHGIAHDVLSRGELVQRFPAFSPPPDAAGLFEPTGGVLFAEACIDAHLTLARRLGATVNTDEAVLRIEPRHDGRVEVVTERGVYQAGRVVVAAGAWAPQLLGLGHVFRVTRETIHWFEPASDLANADQCPVAMIEFQDGPILYTLPNFGDGFKAGLHHAGAVADAALAKTAVADSDTAQVDALVRRFAPAGAGPLRVAAPCFYTTTRDHHFAIGELPSHPGVILASACSGHGFKFAPVLGEALAGMIAGGNGMLPAELFEVQRLV